MKPQNSVKHIAIKFFISGAIWLIVAGILMDVGCASNTAVSIGLIGIMLISASAFIALSKWLSE